MSQRILIVEDEVDVRETIADALTQAGYQVSVAEDGEVGLRLAQNEHPDLILLDLIMPVMDGHEMLRRLRQDMWGKDANVVVLTSMDDATNVASAYEGKITDYIIKVHTTLDELINQVRLALHAK